MRHLLYDCKHVVKLWKGLAKWLDYFIKITIDLTPEIVLLNNYKGKRKSVINTLIVIMKQFIYSSKCFQEIPIYTNFINKVSYGYLTEKYIACETGKYATFIKKWENVCIVIVTISIVTC